MSQTPSPAGQPQAAPPQPQAMPQSMMMPPPTPMHKPKGAIFSVGRVFVGFMEIIRKMLEPIFGRILPSTKNEEPDAMPGMRTFEEDADAAMSAKGTRRAQNIVRAAILILIGLVVWAHFAILDEVTKGQGTVVPSQQMQVIQSLDGGIVSQLLVREGQEVKPGQVLLRIDQTRAQSSAGESQAQQFALEARLARLRALANDVPFNPPVATNPGENRIVDDERRLYDSKRTELATLLSINTQQLAQRQQERAEAEARATAARATIDSTQRELAQTQPLVATGAVSQIDVLRLQRDIDRAKGDLGQAQAQMRRAEAAANEVNRKVNEINVNFKNEARRDIGDAMGRLAALREGAVALQDKVNQSVIKSPVLGRVQRLLINTIGGVVTPGKDIMEIVPLNDELVLETKVQPRDIAFITADQTAKIKFTAYDFSIYGGVEGKVIDISPDASKDEKGNTFYIVRVKTSLTPEQHKQFKIIPGMTAEVDILTGKKSVWTYLMKPILRAHSYALRER
ncbi:HlyD family type I secretion periplasmic adaptor subunit [Amphibiibacter pelophylacis]|uniref:HlyD family type I secretion periplasmic adaptor subunit n=1 Tax=Amphibiibacter pelophylacis TaxID=1799477 RepID=A0ACC6P318_9BURK